MVYMPSEVQGKDRKLAHPYHGLYRVLQVTPTNMEGVLLDRPKDTSVFISLTRVAKGMRRWRTNLGLDQKGKLGETRRSCPSFE